MSRLLFLRCSSRAFSSPDSRDHLEVLVDFLVLWDALPTFLETVNPFFYKKKHSRTMSLDLGHSAIIIAPRPLTDSPLALDSRPESWELLGRFQGPSKALTRPLLGCFLPIFTDFSDFLGRLQPSNTTTHKTPDTLGVEESSSTRRIEQTWHCPIPPIRGLLLG